MGPTESGRGSSVTRIGARLLPLALIGLGIALIVWSVVTGSAQFYLVVIFPVVAGTSALLLLGSGLVVVGFFLLPWTLGGVDEVDSPDPPAAVGASATPSSGGLVLLGPVPLFVGSWRNAPGWAYGLAAGVGLVLLVVFLLLAFGLF